MKKLLLANKGGRSSASGLDREMAFQATCFRTSRGTLLTHYPVHSTPSLMTFWSLSTAQRTNSRPSCSTYILISRSGFCQPGNLSPRCVCAASHVLSSSLTLPSCVFYLECSPTSLSRKLLLTPEEVFKGHLPCEVFFDLRQAVCTPSSRRTSCACHIIIIYFHICLCIKWALEDWTIAHSSL